MKYNISEMYTPKQLRETFPKVSETSLKRLSDVIDKCATFFDPDGSLVNVKLVSGESKIGIIRNCQYILGADLWIGLELRSPNFVSENRFFQDNSKIIRIPMLQIKEVKFIKLGKERLSDNEVNFVENSIREGKSPEEVELALNK